MKMISLLFVALTAVSFAQADDSSVCKNYVASTDYEYGSEITLTGKLRPNMMFQGIDTLPEEYKSISMVLTISEPIFVQGGETQNPISCGVSEFTLHLSQNQIAQFRKSLDDGKLITVTGQVGMAESSIEEYDNATLKNIR